MDRKEIITLEREKEDKQAERSRETGVCGRIKEGVACSVLTSVPKVALGTGAGQLRGSSLLSFLPPVLLSPALIPPPFAIAV